MEAWSLNHWTTREVPRHVFTAPHEQVSSGSQIWCWGNGRTSVGKMQGNSGCDPCLCVSYEIWGAGMNHTMEVAPHHSLRHRVKWLARLRGTSMRIAFAFFWSVAVALSVGSRCACLLPTGVFPGNRRRPVSLSPFEKEQGGTSLEARVCCPARVSVCLVGGDQVGNVFFPSLFSNSVEWFPFTEIRAGNQHVFIVTGNGSA